MQVIKILQIGIGPLGIKTANYISERENMKTVAAVDLNPNLLGKDLGQHCGKNSNGIAISNDLENAIALTQPDIAVVTTVSDMQRITPLLVQLANLKMPVVSTCEELSFPWDCSPELSKQIDEAAKANSIAIVGTGINPGFLMDSLPTFLTAVSQNVEKVLVNRFQNAQFRRIPFQKKIGAGLTLAQFEAKKQDGSLRHVGLTESMQFIAHRMGWKLDKTEDIISPVVAQTEIATDAMTIPAGYAIGVNQVGNAYVNGEIKIKLEFQATVGEPESYDEVIIEGTPRIHSKIEGGVNGDVATCAITLNTIGQVLRSTPGLKTMADIPLVSYL